MAASLSFVDKSSDFFSLPALQAKKVGNELKASLWTVKNFYYYGGQFVVLSLVQTVASVVAIPFQLLVGLFCRCYLGEKGKPEFQKAWTSVKQQGKRVFRCPVAAIGCILLMGVATFFIPFFWNTPFRAAQST